MADTIFTIDDLRRILREGGGEDANAPLDGDILDTDFEQLGYESIALLETSGRIEREYEITLDDSTISECETPRAFVAAVNAELGAQSAA